VVRTQVVQRAKAAQAERRWEHLLLRRVAYAQRGFVEPGWLLLTRATPHWARR
jgi:hypothetical protein